MMVPASDAGEGENTMKYTSAEANKLLGSLNTDHDMLLHKELACREFTAAT